MRINSSIEKLVNDIVGGFENELDYEKVYSIVETLINDGSYTLSELWEINNNDSTEMYHILAMNGDFHKKSVNENKSMKKNKIRITESKLRQIVNESVKNVILEYGYDSTNGRGGYDDIDRLGANAAYNVFVELRKLRGAGQELDNYFIERIIDKFTDNLWALVEVGSEEYGGLGLNREKYRKDIENGLYNN